MRSKKYIKNQVKNAEKRSPIGFCFVHTSFALLLLAGFITEQNTVEAFFCLLISILKRTAIRKS